MTPKLSPRTRLLTEIIFSEKHVEEVVRLLEDTCGNNISSFKDDDEYQMERIRFAVLKLSKGDIKKLHYAIKEARTDYRDLFMAAGFGYDVNAHNLWAEEMLKRS